MRDVELIAREDSELVLYSPPAVPRPARAERRPLRKAARAAATTVIWFDYTDPGALLRA